MGFSVLLDIAGSMIIGLIVLSVIGRVNNNIVQNTIDIGNEFKTQGNITYGVQAIESDLRKMGCSVNYIEQFDVAKALLLADTSSIRFLADLDRDGEMDTVYYYTGATSELIGTQNPLDRYIYRKINNETAYRAVEGVVSLRFQYYDKKDSMYYQNAPVTLRSNIRSVGFSISVAPADSVKGAIDPFPRINWQTKIMARNLYKKDI